jgi:hypothetical protein
MIKLNTNLTKLVALGTVAAVGFAPLAANAQSAAELKRRQQKKNEWRNLGYAGAAVGVLGLLKGDKILTIAGLGGAGYSAWRYEQDRKSQNRLQRQRAQLFSQRYITRNGHRYERRTVWKNGKKYYQFVRIR